MSSFLANIILCVLGFSGFHNHYTSITNAKLNADNNKLEISIKLTAHDIEHHFSTTKQIELKLGSSKEHGNANALISNYITNNLKFSIDNKLITLNFIGKEVQNDETLYLFFESHLPKKTQKVNVINTILIKTFNDQQNILHLSGSIKESFTFNEKLTAKTYYIKN